MVFLTYAVTPTASFLGRPRFFFSTAFGVSTPVACEASFLGRPRFLFSPSSRGTSGLRRASARLRLAATCLLTCFKCQPIIPVRLDCLGFAATHGAAGASKSMTDSSERTATSIIELEEGSPGEVELGIVSTSEERPGTSTREAVRIFFAAAGPDRLLSLSQSSSNGRGELPLAIATGEASSVLVRSTCYCVRLCLYYSFVIGKLTTSGAPSAFLKELDCSSCRRTI